MLAHQDGLAEAGAGGHQAGIAVGVELAALENVQFVRTQGRHTVCHRLDVVENPGAADAGARHQLAAIDEPRHVGEPGHLLDVRPGHTDACELHLGGARAGGAEERRHHRRQTRIVERRVFAHVEQFGASAMWTEEPELRLRAAKVSGEQHAGEDNASL
jgi:hypothetical protein